MEIIHYNFRQVKDGHAYVSWFVELNPLPFVIYADFECINVKLSENDEKANTKKKTHHQVSGFTFVTKSPFYPQHKVSYTGPDAGEVYIEKTLEEEERIKKLIHGAQKEMVFAEEDRKKFEEAETCHICEDVFMSAKTEQNINHLEKMKDWIEINQLELNQIPTLGQVRRQRRK